MVIPVKVEPLVIPANATLKVGPLVIPVKVEPLVIPANATIKVGPLVIPTNATIKVGPLVIPVNATIKVGPLVIPVNATIKVGPLVIPVNATIKVEPLVIPANATIKVEPLVIPANATIKVEPLVIPANATVKVGPLVIPANVTIKVGPLVIPANATIKVGLLVIPANATIKVGPLVILANPTIKVEPLVIPANATIKVEPLVIPANATIKVEPLVIPANATIKVEPLVIPVNATIKVEPLVIPANATIKVEPLVIPANATIKVGPLVIPANATINQCYNQVGPLVIPVNVTIKVEPLVIPANATIKFAPGSFWDLEKSLMYEQNKSYSDAHSTFKNTTGFSQHAGVTESVAGDVLLMNKIDQHWKIPTDAIWRYMGTENGVFKVFPGTLVPDILYDPREDRWYTAAISQSHKYMFTAHPDQNISIVTLAKAFHQTSKLVHGVVAADITVQHLMAFLYNAVFRNISQNSAWIIMDDEGSILMKLDNVGPVQMSAHLTEVLPWVANWLLQKGLLMIDWCSDVLSGHSHLSYSLDTSGSVVDPGSSDPCLDFQLIPINKSNLYVIIYKPLSMCHTTQAACSCTEMCSVCDHLQTNICQCPCTCFSNYMDRCTHQINKTNGYKPCPGPHKHWQMQSSDKENKSINVRPCKPVCTAISGSAECQATKGCNWCSGGHYKNLPLCSEKCIHDQRILQFNLACGKNTTVNSSVREKDMIEKEILQTARQRLKKYNKAKADLHPNKDCTVSLSCRMKSFTHHKFQKRRKKLAAELLSLIQSV
ncbi:uncharacterized protein LOC133195283 [Saccostrea echinata]|uniref:uncharacterized protein LOC133195283 n=1 Tax=Saccostrea echinata TaxID=191078 RepID=UPI002A83A9FF|nr:uncharacterized protein LOC133195283 [Saccostrea echinata]